MRRPAFCVLKWRDGDPEQRFCRVRAVASAMGLPVILDRDGVAVLTNRPAAAFHHGDGGMSLVVGLPAGHGLRPVTTASATAAASRVRDAAAAAAELLSALRGSFAALIDADDGPWLFAEPSGAMPFDVVCGDRAWAATDDLRPELCRAIGLQPRPDWRSVAATLVAPATAVHLSHLEGVRPATPGRLHRLGRGEDVVVWSPAMVARRSAPATADALRAAVDRSVAPLDADSCALQLSGGLDSSIVLSSLCRGSGRPMAINLATAAAGGDERRYARAVASACGAALIERVADGLPSYRRLFESRAGAHPFVFGLDDVLETAAADAARAAGRETMVTGQGGDASFFQPATPLVAVDRARSLGFRRATLQALLDDARRMRSSVWQHLVPAILDRIRPAEVPTQLVVPGLLTAHGRELVGDATPRHPWLDDADDLPPGKRMHVTMLANSQIFHSRRPLADGPALYHPLLSRDVLEAVLPIPTYELTRERNDRGLAREAFADRLPAAILARRTKGDAADHYSRAAVANLPLLVERLMDGTLVREGIVDRSELERTLTREHLFYSLDYRALVMHATCEAWASYWEGAAGTPPGDPAPAEPVECEAIPSLSSSQPTIRVQ